LSRSIDDYNRDWTGRTCAEKTALLSAHIRRIACPLSEAKRDHLRAWAGRRLGRIAFADDIQRQVVDPIRDAVKKVRRNAAHRTLFGAVTYYGLQYTPAAPTYRCCCCAMNASAWRSRPASRRSRVYASACRRPSINAPATATTRS
jgi:hypothetical protein